MEKEDLKHLGIALVDISTCLWLIFFMMDNIMGGYESKHTMLFGFIVFVIFFIDLIIAFLKYEHKSCFVKVQWYDILLALPYFKLVKIVPHGSVIFWLIQVLRITKCYRIVTGRVLTKVNRAFCE